ncbi:MAG: alpha/beta hydrolase fold domain-containing protein [Sphingomonadales bacterium]|nr:alpha/beta hydrolase fold domain-containing protein [Sphingomonadales bacterium]
MRPRAAAFEGSVITSDLPHGAKLYHILPDGLASRRAEVAYFDIHGGGFTAGGGEMCRIGGMLRAMSFEVPIYAVDYRLAPEHRYPAALDDVMAAYREVLNRVAPANLVVGGASAGGNLAAALLLRAHDEGLSLPAGLVLNTPATDLTGNGDSRATNRFLDLSLYGGAADGPDSYVGEADPREPYLSPIYAAFPPNWPPTLLTTGTRDLLLSDTVRIHRALRRSGIAADLHVTEAGIHIGFMGSAPEDHEIIAECRRFCEGAWGI